MPSKGAVRIIEHSFKMEKCKNFFTHHYESQFNNDDDDDYTYDYFLYKPSRNFDSKQDPIRSLHGPPFAGRASIC